MYARHNSSACHVYVMWVELGVSHFLSSVTREKGAKIVMKGSFHLLIMSLLNEVTICYPCCLSCMHLELECSVLSF